MAQLQAFQLNIFAPKEYASLVSQREQVENMLSRLANGWTILDKSVLVNESTGIIVYILKKE